MEDPREMWMNMENEVRELRLRCNSAIETLKRITVWKGCKMNGNASLFVTPAEEAIAILKGEQTY
jgi:hypothetical protein